MGLCRHFGVCGGCTLQDREEGAYRDAKRALIVGALTHAGVDAKVEAPISVPPFSRRRAVFKFAKMKNGVEIGFHAARSHDIADMQECRVLTPVLFAFTGALRRALAPMLKSGEKGEVHALESEAGLDLGFRWDRKLTPALTAEIARAFSGSNVCRVVSNDEILFEARAPMVTFSGAALTPPPYAFLQPTREGEALLQQFAVQALAGAKHVADLFAGCGTFALTLARKAKVHAVEQDGGQLAALGMAARAASGLKPVTTEKRDLFKRPLTPTELGRFDGALLDPPRAGAQAQIAKFAASKIARIVYISCDPASFARDARILVDAGFAISPVVPIDQFLWSGHIELAASFTRGRVKA